MLASDTALSDDNETGAYDDTIRTECETDGFRQTTHETDGFRQTSRYVSYHLTRRRLGLLRVFISPPGRSRPDS